MPASRNKGSAPLTFDLPASLIAKIQKTRRVRQLATASDVVRLALAGFQPRRDPHVQISVRIPGVQRTALRRWAHQKDASLGEVVRAALDRLPVTAPRARR